MNRIRNIATGGALVATAALGLTACGGAHHAPAAVHATTPAAPSVASQEQLQSWVDAAGAIVRADATALTSAQSCNDVRAAFAPVLAIPDPPFDATDWQSFDSYANATVNAYCAGQVDLATTASNNAVNSLHAFGKAVQRQYPTVTGLNFGF